MYLLSGLILLCISLGSLSAQLLTGGLTQARPADQQSQAVAEKVMNAVQSLVGRTFTEYTVQLYRSQVVAGSNYYLKVYMRDTTGRDYVAHLKVYQPLRGEPELSGISFPNMWNDPISFDGYTNL